MKLYTALLCAIVFLPSAHAQTIVYAPLPMQNVRDTLANSQPLIAHLNREAGLTIEVRQLDSYGDILTQFAGDEIDLAYLGPLPFLALEKMAPHAVAVVAFREDDGSPNYTCALAAPYDGVATLSALASEAGVITVALTQHLSTCGYLASVWQLQRAGIDTARIEVTYLGSHEAVALALVRGEYMLGGIKSGIAAQYGRLGIHVLAESPQLPGFVLVANGRRLSEAQILALRTTLLNAPPPALQEMDLGLHGFAPPDPSAYGIVEQMLHDTGLEAPSVAAR